MGSKLGFQGKFIGCDDPGKRPGQSGHERIVDHLGGNCPAIEGRLLQHRHLPVKSRPDHSPAGPDRAVNAHMAHHAADNQMIQLVGVDDLQEISFEKAVGGVFYHQVFPGWGEMVLWIKTPSVFAKNDPAPLRLLIC